MKIKAEHFEYLQAEIEKALIKYPNVVNEYETGQFPRSEKVKDLQTRFNNDMKFGAGLNRFICDTLYPYLNDTHINTALNKICPKLERRF